jgi:AcrR family transcriptional regulator
VSEKFEGPSGNAETDAVAVQTLPDPVPRAASRAAKPPAGRTGPVTRDPERTSAAILAAAIAEFSEKGVGGARIDRVADRAGVNKRMIYHYFGDKQALYGHVLRTLYGRIRAAERDLKLESSDPAEAIRQLALFTWRYFVATPEFLSLLAAENLARADTLKRAAWTDEVNSPLIGMISDILKRGEASGQFKRGLDPVDVYVTIAGLGWFYLSNQHTLSVAFGRDFTEERRLDIWGEHVADVVLAWLKP